MATECQKLGCVSLRTMPIIVENGSKSLIINALLADGSTQTYINADIAGKLGLNGEICKSQVNVINGSVATFETAPVEFRLKSMNGQVNIVIEAFTKTNMLIGVDYPGFHFSLKDIRGKPGEPIGRPTPLGWICIGKPNNTITSWHQNQYTRSYFSSTNGELVKIGDNIKKFWAVKNISGKVGKKIISPEDKMALKMVDKSIKYDGQWYEVANSWKKHPGTCLLNNDSDAEKRLHHIENQLVVCKAYEETINQYQYLLISGVKEWI